MKVLGMCIAVLAVTSTYGHYFSDDWDLSLCDSESSESSEKDYFGSSVVKLWNSVLAPWLNPDSNPGGHVEEPQKQPPYEIVELST